MYQGQREFGRLGDLRGCCKASERHSRAPRWSAGPMTCFTQLKLNLHWRGPRWSAGPLRCRTKACHSTRGLVSALTWFGSVLEAAVGGALDDASQGCLLALNLPCLRVCVTIVQTCLTCCLGVQVVYTFIACGAQASREQMCQIRTTHAQKNSQAAQCHPAFIEATGGSEDVYGCQ
jgi:hypothetical protein